MKKGDVIRQKCVNTTFYLTGILAHKVNNTKYIMPKVKGNSEIFKMVRSRSAIDSLISVRN